jgi:hypothetical protein
MLAKSVTAIWALLLLITSAQAQFQFFEQMFGGGSQQGRQQEQEASSDSTWYQRTWDGGENIFPLQFLDQVYSVLAMNLEADLFSFSRSSALYKIPLSGHISLRSLSASLPVPSSGR